LLSDSRYRTQGRSNLAEGKAKAQIAQMARHDTST